MGQLTRKCPNDGSAMVVSINEPMGILFVCQVCGIEKPHWDFHERSTDVVHEAKRRIDDGIQILQPERRPANGGAV